ncbi:MAG: ABC transporter substrate-binding protein [Terrimicrobiaceae bacterium]|nr:ABC transporter substrate-binding protein [Terrimicrobiaceae bacterium]
MKSIRSTVLSAITALACAIPQSHAADLTPYRVGFNNWVGFIAFFVALERGDFAKAGLDVQARSFSAPGEGLVPLLSGGLDAHLTTLDAVVLKSAQAPGDLKIVSLIDTSAGADAVLGSAHHVTTPGDLKGKRVAVTVGECNELLLTKALESAGLTEKDIQVVNMDPDAAGTALKAGAVDAAVTWEPWISQLVGAKAANAIFTSKEVPNLLADCVAVSRKSNPDTTKKFLAVLASATDFVLSHPHEAADLVARRLELPAADIEAMLAKVKIYDTPAARAQMAGPALKSAEEIATFFQAKGTTPGKIEVAPLFDTALLP